MGEFTMGDYTLSGAEYWPYHDLKPLTFPDDVLWEFYPTTATPVAVACARRAYAELRAFLRKDPPELREIVRLGAAQGITPKFYLWTNDYSTAATPYVEPLRPARFWYWKRETPEPDKPPGYWKWESTVDQSGECRTPDPQQIAAYLAEKLDALRN
jgi:hypothetical protein